MYRRFVASDVHSDVELEPSSPRPSTCSTRRAAAAVGPGWPLHPRPAGAGGERAPPTRCGRRRGMVYAGYLDGSPDPAPLLRPCRVPRSSRRGLGSQARLPHRAARRQRRHGRRRPRLLGAARRASPIEEARQRVHEVLLVAVHERGDARRRLQRLPAAERPACAWTSGTPGLRRGRPPPEQRRRRNSASVALALLETPLPSPARTARAERHRRSISRTLGLQTRASPSSCASAFDAHFVHRRPSGVPSITCTTSPACSLPPPRRIDARRGRSRRSSPTQRPPDPRPVVRSFADR